MTYNTEPPGLASRCQAATSTRFLCSEPVGLAAIKDGAKLKKLDTPAFFTQKTGYIDRSLTLAPAAFVDADRRGDPGPARQGQSSRSCRSSSSAPTTRPRPGSSTSRRSARRFPSGVTRVIGRLTRPFRRSLRARLVGSFLPAVDGHRHRRQGGRLRPGDGDLIGSRSTTASTRSPASRPTRSTAGSTSRAANVVCSSGVMPGVGDDARAFLDDAATAADRTAAEARLREVFKTVVSQTADAEEIYVLDLDGTVRAVDAGRPRGRVAGEGGRSSRRARPTPPSRTRTARR